MTSDKERIRLQTLQLRAKARKFWEKVDHAGDDGSYSEALMILIEEGRRLKGDRAFDGSKIIKKGIISGE